MDSDDKPTDPPVEMANDEGADPSKDIEQQNPTEQKPGESKARGNVYSEKGDDPELDAPQAHPS